MCLAELPERSGLSDIQLPDNIKNRSSFDPTIILFVNSASACFHEKMLIG